MCDICLRNTGNNRPNAPNRLSHILKCDMRFTAMGTMTSMVR